MKISKEQLTDILTKEGWTRVCVNEIVDQVINHEQFEVFMTHVLPSGRSIHPVLYTNKTMNALVDALKEYSKQYIDSADTLGKFIGMNDDDLELCRTGDTRDAFRDAIEDAHAASKLMAAMAQKVEYFYQYKTLDARFSCPAMGICALTLEELRPLYNQFADPETYPDFIGWFTELRGNGTLVEASEADVERVTKLHSLKNVEGIPDDAKNAEYTLNMLKVAYDKFVDKSKFTDFIQWFLTVQYDEQHESKGKDEEF